jgi:hypothetical protein
LSIPNASVVSRDCSQDSITNYCSPIWLSRRDLATLAEYARAKLESSN